jgi:hypothetical protein
VAAPTFRNSSKRYDYLNNIQAINIYKVIWLSKEGGNGRVDVYGVR